MTIQMNLMIPSSPAVRGSTHTTAPTYVYDDLPFASVVHDCGTDIMYNPNANHSCLFL